MPARNGTPPDLGAIYQQVLSSMGGPVEVETPQLGRVAYPRPSELYAALNYLTMLQNAAAGVPGAGVFVVGYNRGLGPTRGCY